MEQNTYFIPSVKNKGSVRSLASISAHSNSTRPGSRGQEDASSISRINSRSNTSNKASTTATPRSRTMMAALLRKMRMSPAIMKLRNNLETPPLPSTSFDRNHDLKDLASSNSVIEEVEQETTPRKSSSFGTSWSRGKVSPVQEKDKGLNGLGLVGSNGNHQVDREQEQEEEAEDRPRSSMSGGWRARVQSLSSTKSGKSEQSGKRGISSSTPPPPTPPLPAGRHLFGPQPPRPSTSGNDSSEIPNNSQDSSWRWNLLNEAVGLSLGGGGRSVSATSSSSPSSSKDVPEKVRSKKTQKRHGEIEVPPSIAATPSVSEQQNVTIRKTLSPRILTDESYEADALVEEVGSGSEAEEELKDLVDQERENDSVLLRQHGEPIEAIDEAEELSTDGASSVTNSRRESESGYDSNQGGTNLLTSTTGSRSKSPALTVSRPSIDREAKSSFSPKSPSSFSDFQTRRSEDHRRAPPPAALDLSPSSQSKGRFEDDSTNSPFLGGNVDDRETSLDNGKKSNPNSTPNLKNNIVPAFFLKSPASDIKRTFSTDKNVDRSPVSNRPISPSVPSPGFINSSSSPKVTTGLFGALKSGMGISSSGGKHSPYGLASGVSSAGQFGSQTFDSHLQTNRNGGLEAVEEATRLLQSHTDAMTPSPMPSPMPTNTNFSENQLIPMTSSSSSNGQVVTPIGLGLGSAWEAQNASSSLPPSSSTSSLTGGGSRVRQVSNSSLLTPGNKTPQTPELRAFDDMLRGFGKADKALLKDIAARSKDSPLQTQSPIMGTQRE